MKNVIYKICDKLRGYSDDVEYFEVLNVTRKGAGLYTVEICVIEPKDDELAVAEGAKNADN